jgi:hypothetical protein
MSVLKEFLHLDDGEFPAVRARIEAQPAPIPPRCHPRVSAADALAWMRAQDRRADRDPCRYDPNRLLPTSAMVRRVRVDRVPVEAPLPVAELCAAAGLVYAERHIAAALAPDTSWGTHAEQLGGAL